LIVIINSKYQSRTKNKIDSLENALSEIIDGGNTEELNYEIQTSFPPDSILLRNDLLSESPYLSDTVMISLIGQESVLSSEMVTEILSANPHAPKSTRVIEALTNRFQALNEEQLELIFEGLSLIGPKEEIEAELSDQKTIHSKNLNKLLHYYKKSYPKEIASDSIYNILTDYGGLQGQYELISEFLSLNDTIKAMQIYSAIPTMFTLNSKELEEHESFEDYLGIRFNMINQELNILTPDSSMKILLYNILGSNHVPSSTFARNMLIATDTLLYFEPIILPEPGLKLTKQIRKWKDVSDKTLLFTLYPNPASYYLIAKYDFLESGKVGYIDFLDATGHICKQVYLRPGSSYEVINITDLPSGLYLCKYYTENHYISTIKVCISR